MQNPLHKSPKVAQFLPYHRNSHTHLLWCIWITFILASDSIYNSFTNQFYNSLKVMHCTFTIVSSSQSLIFLGILPCSKAALKNSHLAHIGDKNRVWVNKATFAIEIFWPKVVQPNVSSIWFCDKIDPITGLGRL